MAETNSTPSQITLRPFTLSDIDDFMVWATDEKVTPFCTWDTYKSKESAINYLQDVVLPHPFFRAICLDGRPIGAVSVTENRGNDRCRGELGYVLGSAYWGRGIVTEAVKMAAKIVFEERENFERIEALVDVDNVSSQRVCEKVGFQREGVLRKYFEIKGKNEDGYNHSFRQFV
ncbi:hypothetical protein LguiA_001546 [Lonicera macranthoides]